MEVPTRIDHIPEGAHKVFGDQVEKAAQFERLLRAHGVERGLIGPRETDRLWDRHLINSAVIGELIPSGSTVLDVGSGAGLPGISLAIARPDLRIILLETMLRRTQWLNEVAAALNLPVQVVRGRAEDPVVRKTVLDVNVVTARAVAPLGRLAGWCLPYLAVGGKMLALKGASAEEEISRDAAEIAKFGGIAPAVVQCGIGLVKTPTTVVAIERRAELAKSKARRSTRSLRLE